MSTVERLRDLHERSVKRNGVTAFSQAADALEAKDAEIERLHVVKSEIITGYSERETKHLAEIERLKDVKDAAVAWSNSVDGSCSVALIDAVVDYEALAAVDKPHVTKGDVRLELGFTQEEIDNEH